MTLLSTAPKWAIASHNKGKIKEIADLIAPYGLVAEGADSLGLPEPEETEKTFTGNALLKARAGAEACGLVSLADDSGLEVTALDGAPGIYSARWAGEPRDFGAAMDKVRTELEARQATDYSARFVCALALAHGVRTAMLSAVTLDSRAALEEVAREVWVDDDWKDAAVARWAGGALKPLKVPLPTGDDGEREAVQLLRIVGIKSSCRKAQIERIDMGPKGAVLTLRNNAFPNPLGLVGLIQKNTGAWKLRPDQKIVVMGEWANPEERLKAAERITDALATVAALDN